MPSGQLELGAEMVFVTSEPRLTNDDHAFGDIALFNVRARRAFANWLELYLASATLAKQPSEADEWIWQGSLIGARAALAATPPHRSDGKVPFASRFAVSLDGAVGPLLAGAGLFWRAHPRLSAKLPTKDDVLRFELSLGNAFTALHLDANRDEPLWLDELTARAEIQLGERKGAFWVALDYRVPLASNADEPDPQTQVFLDPQIALDLQVGGVLSLTRAGWDLFVAYTVVDRGELQRPETTLPILDGGFDQHQTLLGVQYRFRPKPKPQDLYVPE